MLTGCRPTLIRWCCCCDASLLRQQRTHPAHAVSLHTCMLRAQLRHLMLMGVLGFATVLMAAGVTVSFFHLDHTAKVSVWCVRLPGDPGGGGVGAPRLCAAHRVVPLIALRHTDGIVRVDFTVPSLALSHTHTHTVTQFNRGTVTVLILVLFYSAPLSVLADVFRTRSSAALYLPFAVMNCVNGVLWTAYGESPRDAVHARPGLMRGEREGLWPLLPATPSLLLT